MPTADHATRIARSALPEALLDRFRQHRGETDAAYWSRGDDVADAIAEYAAHGMQAKIIRAAALEMELSRGEVRVLFETARACDPTVRDEYGDVLTHSHFRAVRYVDPPAKLRAYLALAVESAAAYGGRPMPAAKLAAKVRLDLGHAAPDPTKAELIERAVRAVERVRAISENSSEHDALDRMMTQLERMVNKV